jgi:hypothetical protein
MRVFCSAAVRQALLLASVVGLPVQPLPAGIWPASTRTIVHSPFFLPGQACEFWVAEV